MMPFNKSLACAVLWMGIILAGCTSTNNSHESYPGLVYFSVAKASNTHLKVTFKLQSGETRTELVPVEFEAAASWDKLKREYYVRPEIISMIEKGKMKFVMAGDGSVTFETIDGK